MTLRTQEMGNGTMQFAQSTNITFDTQNVDVAHALEALDAYRSGNFELAIHYLAEVLKAEPENWQARSMVSVCYYKTGDYRAAQWSFRVVYEKAQDSETRALGLEGLQASNAKLMDCPAEFASFYDRSMPKEHVFGWLDHAVKATTKAPARRAWRPSYSR